MSLARTAFLAAAALLSAGHAWAAPANDYPTAARVDYVLGCMASNGDSQQVMTRCSCSIDAIADRITYDEYVTVETVRVMSEMPGERGGVFRDVGWAKDLLEKFRQAQVAADRQCF
jgi:propanediol dehydratase small subunit